MGNNESKGLTLTEKIIKNHIIDGEMIKGTEIGAFTRLYRPQHAPVRL